jgi:hypothetical protein
MFAMATIRFAGSTSIPQHHPTAARRHKIDVLYPAIVMPSSAATAETSCWSLGNSQAAFYPVASASSGDTFR